MPADNELESYPFYPVDWRNSDEVATMSAAEQGVYRNLLDVCWQKGSLPVEISALERISFVSSQDFHRAWPKVSRCFVEIDGRLHNRKVDAKRPDVLRSKSDRSKGGRIRAEQMWGHRKANSSATMPANSSAIAQLQPTPSPSPSPSLRAASSVVQETRARASEPAAAAPSEQRLQDRAELKQNLVDYCDGKRVSHARFGPIDDDLLDRILDIAPLPQVLDAMMVMFRSDRKPSENWGWFPIVIKEFTKKARAG